MKKKLTVLVDMDQILVEIIGKWLRVYNEEHHDTKTVADIKTFLIGHNPGFAVSQEACDDIFRREGFFLDPEPVPGAIEGMTELHRLGHDLLVVSSPMDGRCAHEKYLWLGKRLPWLPLSHIIMAHRSRKVHVRGDVLLDDSPEVIRPWFEEHVKEPAVVLRSRLPCIMTIAYPWNEDVGHLCTRYPSWEQPERAWARMVADIKELGQ